MFELACCTDGPAKGGGGGNVQCWSPNCVDCCMLPAVSTSFGTLPSLSSTGIFLGLPFAFALWLFFESASEAGEMLRLEHVQFPPVPYIAISS